MSPLTTVSYAHAGGRDLNLTETVSIQPVMYRSLDLGLWHNIALPHRRRFQFLPDSAPYRQGLAALSAQPSHFTLQSHGARLLCYNVSSLL